MTQAALIFDVFGTLVDWRSSVTRAVDQACAAKGLSISAADFADAWRDQYQPSMAPIRDGTRDYVPLDVLHFENLAIVLGAFGLADAFTVSEQRELTKCWEKLDPWPDVPSGLRDLKKHGFVAPCSNGSVALMARLARHGGLCWDAILGADLAQNYKPHPSVYHASCHALGLDVEDVIMVAAHNDDLATAAALGLQTAFVARPTEHGPAQAADLEPTGDWTIVARDLPDLARLLG